jgi:hypothetical protein
MKLTFIICNSYFTDRVMAVLATNGVDYFTRWDNATGKGHGTEPHLGSGAYASTNSVLMIAFQDDTPLEGVIRGIRKENQEIKRPADQIRLFQLPLERIV